MDKAIVAAVTACSSDVDLMSSDRLEALAGGHGMLNLAVFGIAEVILEHARGGTDFTLHPADEKRLPLDEVLEKAIRAARAAGCRSCERRDAQCRSAVSGRHPGSGGRPPWAIGNSERWREWPQAWVAAGWPPCPRRNPATRFPGSPRCKRFMRPWGAGELSRVDGANIPLGVGALFIGHGSLGEDYLFPEICSNAARVGTEAMLKSMAGAGMRPDPLVAALFGAAATLEIVHPDALGGCVG